ERRQTEKVLASLQAGAQGAFAAVLLGGVFGASWWQARSALYAAWMTGGLALAAGLLALGALALVRVAARPRWQAPLVVRRGLAALAQPSAGTLSAIVALGLGVAVVVTMWRVEAGLSTELGRGLPDDAPSVFLVDIQPDQWPAVEAHLEATGALRIDSAPVVTARLAELDGRPVDELAAERDAVEGEDGRSLRREKRLTYLDTLPEDNTIVAGALWSDPERNEISLDEAFARSMGVRLGSTIVYDVQGILVPVVVTSLRSVDWGTFGLNFFAVVEPGVLDDAPQLRFAAARVPEESVQTLQDTLALETPNVTVIQVLDVIERVRAILGRLAIGIRLLGLLTVVAGLAILAGAVASTTARRGRLVALFKALGMTRRQIAATFAVEYGLIGAVAGLLGTAAGGALAWGILRQALDVEPTFVWWWPAAALATTIALSIGAGLAASVRALERPPIDALRAAD
ncbi:MAG: FtsX-like permease family protein, partial [Acidobacteriota bacterium]